MEKLITPEFGLMFWTVVNFVILLLVLRRFAWKPILSALEAREEKLRLEREGAEAARAEAEKIRDELNEKFKAIAEMQSARIAEAEEIAKQQKEAIIAEALKQSKQMLERTKHELEQEKNRLVGQLRGEVAALSLDAAEKIMRRQADPALHKQAVDEMFEQLGKK